MKRVGTLALAGLMMVAAGCGGSADDVAQVPPNGVQQDATVGAARSDTATPTTGAEQTAADQTDDGATALPSTAGPLPFAAATGGVSLLIAALLRARRWQAARTVCQIRNDA